MKNPLFMIAACIFVGTCGLSAQEIKEKQTEVTKYTVMERFDSEEISTFENRTKLREEHLAEIKRRREILDTLDISERKRQRLLEDLITEPFSNRLSRTMAEIEFQDEE
ncbi:hypothetical protein [Zobellia uliginosa]|uniref:hypothetical protein n=1 Tax=Zobellia uliginosa TaxID=143224 RepID=UPI001C06D691|nr:hypothetical protein [Zobellia uliginosa]MBU2946611.1 hypothetical protein [Zobellia uliginosa]